MEGCTYLGFVRLNGRTRYFHFHYVIHFQEINMSEIHNQYTLAFFAAVGSYGLNAAKSHIFIRSFGFLNLDSIMGNTKQPKSH